MASAGGAIPIDVAITLAVWIEMFLYGIYSCLFASAVPAMMKRRTLERASSTAWVFLLTNIAMYLVASLHLSLVLYRFMRAFIVVGHPGNSYYLDTLRWDNILHSVLLCMMSWLGDCLVIYRCYYVWDCNFWVILLPLLLVFTTIGTNSYILYWFAHPYTTNIDSKTLFNLFNSIYPLAFVQNFLTTSLIALKIWKQHRASTAAGIVDRGPLRLMHVFRIVVESAMVYTLQIFILIILYFRRENVQVVFQAAIVPSIGIVFVLIALRVHLARNKPVLGTRMGTILHWSDEDETPVELSAQGSASTSGGHSTLSHVPGAVNGSEDRRSHDEDSEPFPSSNYNSKGDIGDKV